MEGKKNLTYIKIIKTKRKKVVGRWWCNLVGSTTGCGPPRKNARFNLLNYPSD